MITGIILLISALNFQHSLVPEHFLLKILDTVRNIHRSRLKKLQNRLTAAMVEIDGAFVAAKASLLDFAVFVSQ